VDYCGQTRTRGGPIPYPPFVQTGQRGASRGAPIRSLCRLNRAPLFRQPPQLIPERLTSKPVSASRKARSSSHSSPPRLQRLPPDFSKPLCHHSLSRSETTPVNLTPAFTPPNRAVKSSPHHHVLCDPPPNFNHPPRIFVATTASNFSRAGSSPFAHLAPSVHPPPPPPPRQAGSARRDPPAPLRSVPSERGREGGGGF